MLWTLSRRCFTRPSLSATRTFCCRSAICAFLWRYKSSLQIWPESFQCFPETTDKESVSMTSVLRSSLKVTWGPSPSPGSPPVWSEAFPAPRWSPARRWLVSDAAQKKDWSCVSTFLAHWTSLTDFIQEFTSHPDFGCWSVPCFHLLLEVVDLLSQHLPVVQQIVEVAPGLLSAHHHLHFVEKPRLIT